MAPKVREAKVTPAAGGAEALTAKPMEVDVAVPATVAAALIVDAPPTVELAAFKLMVATPDELVSAVPVEGLRVATVASAALKVTTTLGIGAPVLLNTVAFTVAGVLVVAAPVVGSVRAIDIVGAAVAVVPVPVPEVVLLAPPAPQPDSKTVIATKNTEVNVLA